MKGLVLFAMSCLLAATAPFIKTSSGPGTSLPFPGWPIEVVGPDTKKLPLNKREIKFEKSFPGRMGHFRDGRKEMVIRWIVDVTRKLHPASDCYKGLGYSIKAEPIFKDGENKRWGCFSATKGNHRVHVRERIYDKQGNSWTDVSAWYWSVVLGKSKGPWWAITVAIT